MRKVRAPLPVFQWTFAGCAAQEERVFVRVVASSLRKRSGLTPYAAQRRQSAPFALPGEWSRSKPGGESPAEFAARRPGHRDFCRDGDVVPGGENRKPAGTGQGVGNRTENPALARGA